MQRGTARIDDNGDLIIHPHEPINQDRFITLYGVANSALVDFELVDDRQSRPQQRRLFFALLRDIEAWSGQPIKDLKKYFYDELKETTGKTISLSDTTESSVSDSNQLIELVIGFVFENDVPLTEGHELLPKWQSYYLYQCCLHRRCIVCGQKHSDIHHVDVLGSGRNRNHVDHTQFHVMALCRVHHSEIEQIGPEAFASKHHVPVTGIKLDIETLQKIGVRGNYGGQGTE